MDWNDVPPIWKSCFELAWDAHLSGSNPIAALVADGDGRVIATGKSATKVSMSDQCTSNCEIAHAEVNALLALDNRIHTKEKSRDYTLYVTLEPCPLCFGALYMSDVTKLVFAAQDRYGGSTNLVGTTQYMGKKPIDIRGPVPHLDEVSIFLNVYSDVLRGIRAPDAVHKEFGKDYPHVVKRAYEMALEDSLAIKQDQDFEAVFLAVSSEIGR